MAILSSPLFYLTFKYTRYMKVKLTCADGNFAETEVEEELVFYAPCSLFLDGEQVLIYDRELADPNDFVSFSVECDA